MKIKFKPIDYLNFIYIVIVSCVISIWRKNVNHYHLIILSLIFYVVFIIGITYLYQKYRKNRVIKFFRYCYGLIFISLTYYIIRHYVTVFYGGFLDQQVIDFQQFLFRGQPVLWMEKIISPYLTEYMKFSYFLYYSYVPFITFMLFFKKEYKRLNEFVFVMVFSFYVCFLGFVAYPVQGPRFEIPQLFEIKQLTGFFFTKLQDAMMKNASTLGACMPSSHVTIAWITLWYIRKFIGKKIFYIILPLTVSLTISTVYHRYHYVLDVIAGGLFIFLGYLLGKYIYYKSINNNEDA